LSTTLRQALWDAQAGCCWICRVGMIPPGQRGKHNHPMRASLDHVWPRSVYGENGDFGLTLLAHQVCNSERGNKVPSENEIRVLVSTYRRLDRGVLARFLAEAKNDAERATLAKYRAEMALTFLGRAA
jgi:hypothetical protein